MSLNPEWLRRVNDWREELPKHFYTPLGAVSLSGFTTLEQLTADQALGREFRPMPAGTRWGAKWEYGWFRGAFTLPAAAAGQPPGPARAGWGGRQGQRIVLRVDVGGESLVFVNGAAAGAKDRQHNEITLAMRGEPGAHYDMLVEAYAGHGLLFVGRGPVGYGRESIPEPPPAQAVVGETTFGVWHDEVYQLWLDVETLFHLRGKLDPDSLRVAEIDAGLRDFTLIADPELSPAGFHETVAAARARLNPLLACVNGSTAPTLFTIGHAHLDVAWLWPLQETERKMGRTIANQLALMAEYPDYKFLQSQPHLFTMLRRRYPDLYARSVDAIRRGQLVPEGGMWIEADTNVAGGEALIRQFVHGKRFFQEEFGAESELLWLPDVFGYSGALPQIMAGCGIKYFATQKIFWTYNGGDPFPHNLFTWEGIDGSTVLAHIFNDYNSQTHPSALIERWNGRVQKDGLSTMLVAFGWGDGGGGPTRDHIEYLLRARDLEGMPKARITTPIAFFRDLEARGVTATAGAGSSSLPHYVGELYFQAHRGTYTSQAKTKKYNRLAELALREAEMWAAAAQATGNRNVGDRNVGDREGRPYEWPREAWREAWQTVLLHQFHDILPGSSIHRVYEEAEEALAAVVETAQGLAREAAGALVGAAGVESPTPALTVFNSLSWQRRGLVALPAGFGAATDASGAALPVQVKEGQAWVEVTAPACGWTTIYPSKDHPAAGADAARLHASAGLLENDLLRLEFNGRGEIVSILDKETGREWAAGPCNSLKMYKDAPGAWDAWDVDSMYELMPVPLDDMAEITPIADGPLTAAVRVTRKLHDSTMTQEISLRRGSRRVDCATTVDWRESHKMLKVCFPVTIHANAAVHEVQFGHIRRPNHRSRPFDANRFEVCNHKWSALNEENRGFAVLNDCKYGLNVLGDSINLTLLKSALAPDMTADKGVQTFTYAFYPWNGSLADSGVVREGYELNCPLPVVAGAGGERSLFAVDAANVIIETVKPAEDGSGDIIVRLYEAKRMATRCTLRTTLPVKSAGQTDMLENVQSELALADAAVNLDLRPFEIVTVRLRC